MTSTSVLPAGRRGRIAVAVAAVGLLIVGGLVIDAYFLPERATEVDSGAVDPSAVVLKSGSFSGTAGHAVSGTVSVIERDGTHYLRFEDYRQTQGPDVFVYLTPASEPDTRSEVAAGRKVLIDGGADGGESTVEGTFEQRLPDDLDPAAYGGVAIWCDRFSVPFGSAPLRETA